MPHFDRKTAKAAKKCVSLALAEDLSRAGDITSAALDLEGLTARGAYVFREEAILAGVGVVEEVCRQVSEEIELDRAKSDGDRISAGETAMTVSGPAAAILAAERTSLNFLTHLSGVATLTRKFVDAVAGTGAVILDTRKTLPGLRVLEKYAVRCGGGTNHRMGLFDAVLVKDNHIALVRKTGGDASLAASLAAIRPMVKKKTVVEVEAKTLGEVEAALEASVDVVMLDNMTPDEMREAVAIVKSRGGGRPYLEASGGVTLASVREIALTGVDRISVGALTHSARAVDVSLEVS